MAKKKPSLIGPKALELLNQANKQHDLTLTDADVHFISGELYISSNKAAQFFHATFHSFSNEYVPVLVDNGWVRRAILGKSKWYALKDLEAVMQKAIKSNKSILETCRKKK